MLFAISHGSMVNAKIEATTAEAAAAAYFQEKPLTSGMIATLFVHPSTHAYSFEQYLQASVKGQKVGTIIFFGAAECLAMSSLPASDLDYACGSA